MHNESLEPQDRGEQPVEAQYVAFILRLIVLGAMAIGIAATLFISLFVGGVAWLLTIVFT